MAAGDLTLFDEAKAYLIDGGWESADSIRVALITSAVTPSAPDAVPSMSGGTTNYTEVTAGGNYSAGGVTLDTLANCVTESGGSVTFDDTGSNISWSRNASNPTNARYAVIYNDTDTLNRAIGFIDLGATVDLSRGDLTITWSSRGIFQIDGIYDSFDGSGALDSSKWTTYEDGSTSSELTITQSGGKYNAAHGSSSDAITTWFNGDRGRLDYFVMSGDFDVVLRGAGIGTTGTANDFQFCGLLCGLSQPDDYEFMVNGIRGGSSVVQERKSTVSDNSSQSEHSGAFISGGFSDMRVKRVGSTVTWYTQAPGTSPDSWTEVTSSYTSLGRVSFGTSDVWIGIVTYGYLAIASFTGTVDQVEILVGTPS